MHLITSLVDALWVSTRYNAGRLLVLMGTQHTANRRKSKPLHASRRIQVQIGYHTTASSSHACTSSCVLRIQVDLYMYRCTYSLGITHNQRRRYASYALTNIIKGNQSILAFVIAITFFFTKKMKKSTDSHYTLLALCLYCTDECVCAGTCWDVPNFFGAPCMHVLFARKFNNYFSKHWFC